MVKRQKNITSKNRIRKGFCKNRAKARKINASTGYETCTEQLSPFGGLLALIKFFDLVNFHKIFDSAYQPTSREPRLGHDSMMAGILMLLFNRAGFKFVIANRGCTPVFDPGGWYCLYKRKPIEYTRFIYHPGGWEPPCRFVVRRIPKMLKHLTAGYLR